MKNIEKMGPGRKRRHASFHKLGRRARRGIRGAYTIKDVPGKK
jgi:hypothetical protein